MILFWLWFIFCTLLGFYALFSVFLPEKWRIGWNQVIWFCIGMVVAGSPYAIIYGFK